MGEKLPHLGFVSPAPQNIPEGLYAYGNTEIQIQVSKYVPDGLMLVADQEALDIIKDIRLDTKGISMSEVESEYKKGIRCERGN